MINGVIICGGTDKSVETAYSYAVAGTNVYVIYLSINGDTIINHDKIKTISELPNVKIDEMSLTRMYDEAVWILPEEIVNSNELLEFFKKKLKKLVLEIIGKANNLLVINE